MKGGYYAKNRKNISGLGTGISDQRYHGQEKRREVLDFIILKESAESYIATERGTIDVLDPHIQYGAQKSSLIRRMQKESGADMKDLKCLLTIYLIYMDGNKIVSKISDGQREILERFHINLEVD